MGETTGAHTVSDDLELFVRTWTPDDEPRRGMLIVHGIGDHSGRYQHVARFFVERGYVVVAFDLRGHGRSGGARVHIGSFDEYLDDLQGVIESGLVRTDLPWVIYGHSMGGFISAYYLGEDRPHPDAAVLSTPSVAPEVPTVLRVAAQVLGRATPRIELPSPFTGEQLSRDTAVGEAYFADPLVHKKATAGMALQTFLLAQARGMEVIKSITTPTLVIHGADDTINVPASSAPLAAVDSVERKVYPGLRHEMHNEPEQAQVLAEVAAWLDAALA
jgi:alpha-beta hydrolase superfamily lysophospholipase